MKLSEFISDIGRPIAYYPKLAKIIGGVKSAVFLCQLFYWRGKEYDAEGWIYKTRDEWQDETGLSIKEQNGARRNLKAFGILEEKYDRLHHRKYYRIAAEVLDQLWQESKLPKVQKGLSGSDKMARGESTKGGFVNRNTETTPETTPETTDRRARRAPDPRSSHPAIVAIREITNRYPSKDVYDLLIRAIGDVPDVTSLRECWEAWRGHGFKPTNFAWATEWYVTGIPQNGNGHSPVTGLAAVMQVAREEGIDLHG